MLTRSDYINRPVEVQFELLTLFDTEEKLVIFDVGACEAEDSIRYSNLFPNSTVYAFEPREDNCRMARKLIEEYRKKNIILEQVALSNENGMAEFHLSEGEPPELANDENWNYGNKSSSLLPPSEDMKKYTGWLSFRNKITVPTIRLVDYVVQKKISTIDFMHIDVQGAEKMVFEGAAGFMENIKVIWTEVEAVELYKNQPVRKDIEAFMRENNFENVHDTVGVVSGDQLFVNRKHFGEDKINYILNARQKNSFYHRMKSFFGFGR